LIFGLYGISRLPPLFEVSQNCGDIYENDQGRDWDTGISLLKILAFVWKVTVYCFQPHLLSEHTWDWVLLP